MTDTQPLPNAEGVMPPAEDTSGLKKALDAERQARKELEKLLKARETSEAEAKAAKERDEDERKGNYEKIRAQDMAEIKSAKDRADALENRIRNSALNAAAIEAIVSANGIPEALLSHVTAALEVVPDGDEYKVVLKSDPSKKITDYVLSLRAEKAWGFNGSGASGGGGIPKVGKTTTTGKAISSNDLLNLTPKQRFEHFKAGGVLTD